ncbi:class I SAM-dependent methyltransferase [Oceanicoccus sagamiensis]|uniref:Methyltransferase type 11 n=1 Tax=Oceanicoccus sagamiensis TaxID=716816 RepID=A0A1X9N5T4_9GAMM|nr:methyltransferase domain-containing protein [Oceanicoccus sagamiensis]ARN72641.1 hypothetical protein BST96_00040 [Oceanicoccus sagamiensis]
MKINEFSIPYLKGEKFDDYQSFDLSTSSAVYSRLSNIEKLAKGKRVLHIGCCDHLPFIDQKLSQGEWVHEIITRVAEKCLGIDINQASVNYVRDSLKYDNVEYGDILSQKIKGIINDEWDMAILGEILEHVDNPVEFLSAIRTTYSDHIKKIIVTVPNAFSYRNSVNIAKGVERINTDHRYWFSPYTLAKILCKSGLEVEEIVYADAAYRRVRSFKYCFLVREKRVLDPWYADTLIGVGSL